MPKKHQPEYIKQSYTHSSSSSRATTTSKSASSAPTTSVNDLINQSRREQNRQTTADRRDEVSLVASTRTVPPALRVILDIPETAPIIPKRGLKQRAVRGRQVPGPAPPASWLSRSRHAPPSVVRNKYSNAVKLNIQAGFKNLVELPEPTSLQHYALKQMARDWEWTAAYEHINLCTLPASHKALLLSYIALYGPEEGVTMPALKALCYAPTEVENGTGGQDITTLDLSGQIGKISVSELTKYIADPVPCPTDTIEESWDEVEDSILEVPPSLSRFPHLTRLSLAHPKKEAASWSQLLALSKHLGTLTHLSLAYWPTPTLTPNSKTARMVGGLGKSVQYGGSHLYAPLDKDFYEPANVLRRLSVNLYSLKWLDLEGCKWIEALFFKSTPSEIKPKWKSGDLGFGQTAVEERKNLGPDWNGHWAQVEYLRLGYSEHGMQVTRGTEHDDMYHAYRWIKDQLRALRNEAKGKYCHVDGEF